MIRIKLTAPQGIWRQTPGRRGVWGNCQFFRDTDECDYWVVLDSFLAHRENTRCPKGNMILLTGEPPGVRTYDRNFLQQFATVVTCHRNLSHPHVINTQLLPWLVNKDYDQLKEINRFEKTREISLICSTKAFTKGHRKRLKFLQAVNENFKSNIDIYGRGIRPIEDKWDAIARYKYHIVLENGSYPDYWTEKLSDAFLGGAYPFYYGCPNLSDYFPVQSYTQINIDDIALSIKIIKDVVANNEYAKSVNNLMLARKLILDKYNLFAVIAEMCSGDAVRTEKSEVSLKPERMFSIKRRIRERLRPRSRVNRLEELIWKRRLQQ